MNFKIFAKAGWLSPLAAVLLQACTSTPEPIRRPSPAPIIVEPPAPVAPSPPKQPTVVSPPKPRPGPAPRWERDGPPRSSEIPPGLEHIPELVPKPEPKSRQGNPKTYKVRGKRYKVMNSAKGFTQIGDASWYGRKFHGRLTSNGETYDMFKLTAAHKNLPLPTYVRVTNLDNGKSTVVRVNDRGPFHGKRIIDLSYAAAVKIDAVSNITKVKVEALTPSPSVTASANEPWRPDANATNPDRMPVDRQPFVPGRHLLQVGSYSSASNARAMGRELVRIGVQDVFVRRAHIRAGQVVHRVVVGPFAMGTAYEQARNQLIQAGYAPIRVNN